MDFSEINWDFNSAGSWPRQVKAMIILLVCCLVAGAGVYMITMDQLAELETLEAKEQELTTTFEEKQRKAVSLEDYLAQFEEIKGMLADMMKQMPTKAQVEILLKEITNTAASSGLEQRLFQPEVDLKKEFYIELPYSIEMVGNYEELGLFVSGLAALSRIVTVHDIEISRSEGSTEDSPLLDMKATIKTYNEITAEESDDKEHGK